MNLFWLQVRPFLSRCRAVLSWLGILGGAAGVLVGTLSPWATFRVFHNIEINLPGIVFLWGGLCLAVAALIFLGMRRSSLLCLVGAFFVLHWTGEASKRVPERVKFQLAGSQLALETSVNRLLDQFHIPDIEIANLSTPNPDLLGAGLGWTTNGAYWLLAGSLLGLPGDPVVVWVYTRTARIRCRACGTRRPVSRAAKFCPHCGVSTLPAHLRPCPHCGNPARPGDFHCVTCGTALAEMT